jgi:hypothetical protein
VHARVRACVCRENGEEKEKAIWLVVERHSLKVDRSKGGREGGGAGQASERV